MATPLTIGFLGAGKMATALARGFIRAEIVFPKEIIASDLSEAARAAFTDKTGAQTIFPACQPRTAAATQGASGRKVRSRPG